MITLNITFTDKEIARLRKAKAAHNATTSKLSWHNFILIKCAGVTDGRSRRR
jgi:hypothetical protein